MTRWREVNEFNDRCHRCDHEARWHKADWHCVKPWGRKDGKPLRCLCDGFVLRPREGIPA